jgi:hypothetical protein
MKRRSGNKVIVDKMHIQLWSEDPKVGDYLEDLVMDWRILLKFILNSLSGKIWLRLRTSGGLI